MLSSVITTLMTSQINVIWLNSLSAVQKNLHVTWRDIQRETNAQTPHGLKGADVGMTQIWGKRLRSP